MFVDVYYLLRPLLPVCFRRYLQSAYFRGRQSTIFPRWPLDVSVENLLERILLLILKATAADAIPFIWFWPNGAGSAAIITHDVETTAGRNFCPVLMDIDESFGIRSSFQIVPEERYVVSPYFLDEIRDRGHEINIQDLNHDGRLFRDQRTFETRVKLINLYGRAFHARGFRSAVLYHNFDWYRKLDFEYDMSIPNTGRLEPQGGGCCTVFPYFVGNVLELPVTTTQDYSLFHILRDYTLTIWRAQVDGATAKHGLLNFIAHPDYLQERKAQETYRDLLALLCQNRLENGMWITTPNEVNTWWRQRNQLILASRGGTWRIEGTGKERARIGYARADGDNIVYTVEPPGTTSSSLEACSSRPMHGTE